jgi:hypothetical protein
LLKEKSKGREIVDKWGTPEIYIVELEKHYKISEQIKSQLYDLRTRENEKHLFSTPKTDDELPF